MDYYTLQITYGGTGKPNVEEFKDMEPGSMAFGTWKNMLREKLYSTGFALQTAPGTWEFISPLRIHTAYLIRQDRKIGP